LERTGAPRSRRESELQREERHARLPRVRTFGDGASAARQGREDPAESRRRRRRARTQQASEALVFGSRGWVPESGLIRCLLSGWLPIFAAWKADTDRGEHITGAVNNSLLRFDEFGALSSPVAASNIQ